MHDRQNATPHVVQGTGIPPGDASGHVLDVSSEKGSIKVQTAHHVRDDRGCRRRLYAQLAEGDHRKKRVWQHGDSTGLGMYGRWYHVQYGDGSRLEYAKMHILANPDGTVVEFEATRGVAGDSPAFQRMFVRLLRGSGIVALDAAYDSKVNCAMIVRNSRVPVIRPRKNARCNGYDARAKMCQWTRNHPDEFERVYGICNNIQSIFSSIKRRIGAFVRAKSLPARTVEIFAMILCHNMTV